MPLLLVLGYVWPEPNSSAAGWRMLSLLQLFRAKGWRVVFASAAEKSPHRVDLNHWQIEEVQVALNCSSFAAQLQEWQPTAVLFDRFMLEEQFGWWVDEVCPQALKLLDSEDLHCLRQARQQAFKQQRALVTADLNSELALREIAAVLRCDLTLTISQAEMTLLQSHYQVPAHQLVYCPFLLEQPAPETGPAFSERQHLSFIGNFRHEPNWQAVLRLKQLWPALRRQLSDVQLHIYGAYPPPKATVLHAPREGFLVKGWADTAREALQPYRLCLAPLSFGAGLKGKVIDALSFGTPVVTTAVGAEGLCSDVQFDDFAGAVAESDDALIAATVRLYSDAVAWQQAQQKAPALLAQFDAKQLGDAVWQRISVVAADLPAHRQHCFTGQLLRYHQFRSTKFMAQWIEAKNRLLALSADNPKDNQKDNHENIQKDNTDADNA